MLNATNIGNSEMPLLGVKHALALSKAYKIQIVIIDNRCTGLECSWDSDSPFFLEYQGLSKIMPSQAPKDIKTCYLLQFDSFYSSFMCNWANDVSNHFVYMLKKQEGFYSEDAKQGNTKKGAVF